MAGLLAVVNLALIFFGYWRFDLTGYGLDGIEILGINAALVLGPVILLIGVGFYLFRRLGQDKLPMQWTDKSEQTPSSRIQV